MQYILTKEEYEALVRAGEMERKNVVDKLQLLCTLAADYVPVIKPWAPDEPAVPIGCILTKKKSGKGEFGYCDHCPVTDTCPYPFKEWSK